MKRTVLLVLLLLVPGFVAVTRTAEQDSGDADKAITEKWEYLVVAGPSTTNLTPTGNARMRKEDVPFGREAFVLEQHMDKLGARGWELVTVAGPPMDPAFYFKRRK